MVKTKSRSGREPEEVFMLNHTLLTLALGFVAATVGANDTQPFDSDIGNVQLETIAEGLEHPWSLAFLPDGSQLVTERAGRLRIIRGGKLEKEPIAGVPDLVAAGQGGRKARLHGCRSEEHT